METQDITTTKKFREAKDSILRQFEQEYLSKLLSRTGGNLSRAARTAGLDRKHLRHLLKRNGLYNRPS